jgi:hypothetical protein
VCDVILASPLAAFDALPPEKQARIYQLLFREVRIQWKGRGAATAWRLLQYRATLGDAVRKTPNAPWGRQPNPQTYRRLGLGSTRGIIVFEHISGPSEVPHIPERGYASYFNSLRELAAAFA